MECPRRAIDRKSKWRIGIYSLGLSEKGARAEAQMFSKLFLKKYMHIYIYTYAEKQENEIITARTTIKKKKNIILF